MRVLLSIVFFVVAACESSTPPQSPPPPPPPPPPPAIADAAQPAVDPPPPPPPPPPAPVDAAPAKPPPPPPPPPSSGAQCKTDRDCMLTHLAEEPQCCNKLCQPRAISVREKPQLDAKQAALDCRVVRCAKPPACTQQAMRAACENNICTAVAK